MKGIDVSEWNGDIDWRAVKAAGIDFAICRSSYGKKNFDTTFQRNVEGAHRAGLICGAYHYSYALTPADAIAEADYCKWLIENSGVLLELPIFFDMEDGDGYKDYHGFIFSRRNVTEICKAFLYNIQPLRAGVYASFSWLEDLRLAGFKVPYLERSVLPARFFQGLYVAVRRRAENWWQELRKKFSPQKKPCLFERGNFIFYRLQSFNPPLSTP